MKNELIILEKALGHFTKNTSVECTPTIKPSREIDAAIEILGKVFYVEIKGEIRDTNKELIVSHIKTLSDFGKPYIVVTRYISKSASAYLIENGINFIDVAGNCYIKYDDIFLRVSGQKIAKEKTANSKAFQSSGLRLIYQLLLNIDNVNLSYRELANNAGISLGSVSDIINELTDKNYILQTGTRRVLKNSAELLDRWIWVYHELLRPKLIVARMNFTPQPNWQNSINEFENTLWGGESGAAIVTKQLTPEVFTLYSNVPKNEIASKLKLLPVGKENFLVIKPFFKIDTTDNHCVSPLLIYADLMNSPSDRDKEIAKLIRENELQYIK